MKYVICSAFLLYSLSVRAQGWSKVLKNSYITSCVTSVKASANVDDVKAQIFCNCTLGKLMVIYPNPTQTPISPQDISNVQKQCVNQFESKRKVGWDKQLEANFLRNCRESLPNSSNRQALCECILTKAKQKYAYPEDLDTQKNEVIDFYNQCKLEN